MNNYEVIVGLEIHVELKTKTKIFSNAPIDAKGKVNSQTTPIDLAYPGTLPTLNQEVIKKALIAALVLNCKINKVMHFDRKNYFYPDTPKNYQITQDETPIGYDGYLEIEVNETKKKIGIERVHIEEDAGKSIHGGDATYLDFNRAGVPLIEIVTRPDIKSSEEAQVFLETLRQILLYAGVSDVKMELGSMRCDANISVKLKDEKKLGAKVELKNLNSIANVALGIDYEKKRQINLLLEGKEILKETRRFDELTGETVPLRSKEETIYRYFPEPDIPYLVLSEEWIQSIKKEIPMLPNERISYYINDLNLPKKDALLLVQDPDLSNFYNKVVEEKINYKFAANYLLGDVKAYLNKNNIEISKTSLTPENFRKLINKIEKGEISSKIAKQVLEFLYVETTPLDEILKRENLLQISDENKLLEIINKVIDENEQSLIDYKSGKERAIKYFMGQIMKETKGKANPELVNKLLIQELNRR